MTPSEIKKQLDELYDEGVKVLRELADKKEKASIGFEYQRWYTKTLRVVQTLAPDRLAEFRGYYEPDPKRKSLGYGTYVIQDFFKGVAPAGYSNFDTADQAARGIFNQLAILQSLVGRIDSALSNLETTVIAEFQDAELATARDLLKVSPRAAGAVAGVVLEAHLQKTCKVRGLSLKKKNPTLSDLNDALKQADAYDTPTWRKVSYLADIRNLCSHKKGCDPTLVQVTELIDGVNWAVKTLQ